LNQIQTCEIQREKDDERVWNGDKGGEYTIKSVCKRNKLDAEGMKGKVFVKLLDICP